MTEQTTNTTRTEPQAETAPTSNIKKLAVAKAMAFLQAAGARFAVIEEDGTTHGELTVVPPEERKLRRPKGTFINYVKETIGDMQPGDIRTVPWGDFSEKSEREGLRGTLSTYMSSAWGRGTYITSSSASGIEVLRAS